MNKFDRLYELHKRLAGRHTPIATSELMHTLECSEPTVRRLIAKLHDELDAAVLDAYGWADLAAPTPATRDEALLDRLVQLNAERAREEAAGTVRWLRPAFQARPAEAAALDLPAGARAAARAPSAAAPAKQAWPADLPGQLRAVAALLAAAPARCRTDGLRRNKA